MAKIIDQLSSDKIKEIEAFLLGRFDELDGLRSPLDDEIKKEIDLYNNIDADFDSGKQEWEENIKTPMIYTIVQTIVARQIQSLFASDNYVKTYFEDEQFIPIEKNFQRWAQTIFDKMRLKNRARDFIEDALVQRLTWLQLKPVKENGRFKMDFEPHEWFNVWFDPKVKKVEDSDYFIRVRAKLWRVIENTKTYSRLEDIKDTDPPDFIKERQTYEAKHGETYYDPAKNNITDEIEILEWYGWYDMSDNPDEPKFKPVIFALGNRTKLIRAETVDLPTKRKILLFPVRPLRQANSIISKSIPQLVKDLQRELNDTKSLRLQNFKLMIKLLFKFKKDGSVNMTDLFAKAGNAVGFEDDPKDIDIFNIPNLVNAASFMGNEILREMQTTTGAVDPVIGVSGGGGETATEVRTVTEQALFKFGMMAENLSYDIKEFMNYAIVLNMIEDRDNILIKHSDFMEYFDLPIEDLEENEVLDITLKDISQRRDVERSQFINLSSIALPILQQTGGNVKEYLRQVFAQFDIPDSESILAMPDEQQQFVNQLMQAMSANPQLAQIIQQLLTNPEAIKQFGLDQQKTPSAALPEEEVLNEVPETR